MGRPREFDIDVALRAAMQTFWQHGYAATSMAMLMEAMDLRKGSIYKAFGDKHQLFIASIRYYLDLALRALKDRMSAARSIEEALGSFLQNPNRACPMNKPEQGCFALNAVMELSQHDETVRLVLDGHFKRVHSELIALLREAQGEGRVRTDKTPEALATFLTTFQIGLVSSAKQGLAPQAIEQQVQFAIEQLVVR